MKKHKSKPLVLLMSSLLLVGLVKAQQSANASGGDATGTGGKVAYSVGQVFYTTQTGTNGTVSQGVQHVYTISNLGNIETVLNISLTTFPNPTQGNLILEVSHYTDEKLSYQLVDLQGKQLRKGEIVAQQTHISMHSLPTATYFLTVLNQENKELQSFKIIKN